MTTLRVILDEMVSSKAKGLSRYSTELAAALIESAPRGCVVEGFVASSPESDYDAIAQRLPGLGHLHKSALARRELAAAWQHGFTRLPGSGMVHATSLFAPLGRHDRLNDGDQISVSIHDTVAWTHPESLTPREVSWHKGMVKRSERHADAIVVPSHTVAEELREIADFGDRVRVIAGAPSSTLITPVDHDDRAWRMGLPLRYVLAIGPIQARRGTDELVRAMSKVPDDVPLLIADMDDDELAGVASDAGLGEGRLRGLGHLDDGDLAVVIDRASVFAYPNLAEGFGAPMLEAFAHGTPVVHSDAPALLELAADSGIVVEREGKKYASRLAEAINSVLDDAALAERLKYYGLDRSQAYTWRGAADKIWQLHADL